MGKEIEAKFININKKEVIDRIEKLGAVKVFDERLFKRYVYDLPIFKKWSWARIRDEGDKITMTYKRVIKESLDGVEETELIVNDFNEARDFLKSTGFIEKAYQETRRTRYVVKEDGVELDIDTWPGLESFIEIEASNEEIVKKYANLLGFNWTDAMFGGVGIVYEKSYKVDASWVNNQCKVLKFGDLPKELQKDNLRHL